MSWRPGLSFVWQRTYNLDSLSPKLAKIRATGLQAVPKPLAPENGT